MFAGSHYRMERFTAIVLVLVMCLGLCIGLGFRDKNNANKIVLGVAAKYTGQTMFSLSRDVFDVIDVYRSSDYTKAFILLKTTSMSNLPLDASKYQMFMTSGDDSKPLTGNPVGGIYIFGNTGYIGLSFMDKNGFASNLYNIVLRNFDMVVAGRRDLAAENYGKDSSFTNFNQLPITANLAGTGAKVVPFLDAESFTVSDVYMQLVGEQTASNVRSRTSATLLSMSSTMLAINNAAAKLESRNLVVPELPNQIATDRITLSSEATAENPKAFDPGMMSYSESGSLYRLDSNVPILTEEELIRLADSGILEGTADEYSNLSSEDYTKFTANDTLYLKTDYVFPGGVQFNYQDANLTEDLLNELKDPSVRYSAWVALKAAEKNRYPKEMVMPEYSWVYTTGEALDPLDMYSSQADKDTWAIIEEYTAAVSALFSLKLSYQTELLYNYLLISNEGQGIASIFSVNANNTTLLLY